MSEKKGKSKLSVCMAIVFVITMMVSTSAVVAVSIPSHIQSRNNYSLFLSARRQAGSNEFTNASFTGSIVQPMRLPPPPPGVYATIAFYIFNGLGEITFNGVTYSNGQSVKVTGDESYPILTSNVNSNYHFQQWDSNIGSFDGSTSSSTTFNAGSGTGNIVLVLHEKYTSDVYNNWAGYISTGNSYVEGTIQVPHITGTNYVPDTYNGSADGEVVSAWIGMGGVSAGYFLQAGILVNVTANGLYKWYFFYQFWDVTSSSETLLYGSGPLPITYFTYFNVYGQAKFLGNTIQVNLSTSNGHSYWSIVDENYTNDGIWWNDFNSTSSSGNTPLTIPYSASTSSAEWIVESPNGNGFVIPSFSHISFSSCNVGPLYNGYRAFGVFGTFGARVVLTWLTTNGNTLYQFLNTTNIVSNSAFEITYGQEEFAG